MEAWYLVYAKNQQEYIAKGQLERQGYKAYLPVMPLSEGCRKHCHTHYHDKPMFPRYLFVRLNKDKDDWQPIKSTIGVTDFVRFGDSPACVPDHIIDLIRSMEKKIANKKQPLIRELKRGDAVVINEGPFEGFEAVFCMSSSKDRVVLLLKYLEKNFHVTLGKELVSAVN